jgi:hypothetical protein
LKPAIAMDGRSLALAAVLAARLVPRRLVHAGPTVCPFRLVTGRPCPACGITRSWSAATRLDVRDSLAWHPLGIPTVLGALAVAAGLAPTSLDEPVARRWAVAGAAVWLAVWVARLARPPARLRRSA